MSHTFVELLILKSNCLLLLGSSNLSTQFCLLSVEIQSFTSKINKNLTTVELACAGLVNYEANEELQIWP